MSDDVRQWSRRSVVRGAALAGGALAVPGLVGADRAFGGPRLVRSGRPVVTHGVQFGDVDRHTGTVWVRADRPARMVVEVSDDPSFRRVRRVRGPMLTAEGDFTGKTVLRDLPAGRRIHVRVGAVDPYDDDRSAEPVSGGFRTVPNGRRDVSFLWTGDIAGQGWGINTDIGGYRIFDAMRELDPDFYLCSGDNIYADNPIEATVTLPDGSVWHNVTTEEKSKVAETLGEFRGAYKYNLLDEPLKRFYASVPQIQQWDDHETHNNWYPGEVLDDDAYTEKRIDVLAARSRQAWHEYTPITPRYDRSGRIYRVQHHGPLLDVFVLDMRWYKDPNSPNRQTFNNGGILGYEQAAWLKRELAASRAVWKVIANDLPMGIVVSDTLEGKPNQESVSQGDNGAPLGRELQMADILSFLKRQDIRNTVWLTTDVHYTAAQYFDPAKAGYSDFNPFWQFVAGPANAGAFQAPPIDRTFGCQQVFSKQPPYQNASPGTEYQFFGQVSIDGASGELTVRLRDNSGAILHTETLQPHRR